MQLQRGRYGISTKNGIDSYEGGEILRTLKKFLIAQKSNNGISLVFCLPEKEGRDFHISLIKILSLKPYRYLYPVGILFFHGPHFGDMYGIADAAFSSLLKAGIKIISSGCSSASVFLVIAEDDLNRAEEMEIQYEKF